ncbi:succinate dehydrogenase, hydrophobic membrane anchor protein [Francisellaceae bacterium]|jgi:succinate dehydrogenase / fumarate reductase membrane anchor subunit|nr:succinate dehydrogenase, hydrophobic membrane anchor protein [Francisellaceae bacterium]
MVKNNVTSLGRSGLRDFFIQRISALVLLAYTLFMFSYIVFTGPVTYTAWLDLFSCGWIKIFTILAALSLMAHSWVGVWTILTDYVHNSLLMGILQTIFILGYIVSFIWTLQILWNPVATLM